SGLLSRPSKSLQPPLRQALQVGDNTAHDAGGYLVVARYRRGVLPARGRTYPLFMLTLVSQHLATMLQQRPDNEPLRHRLHAGSSYLSGPPTPCASRRATPPCIIESTGESRVT